MITTTEQARLEEFFSDGASRVPDSPEYWIKESGDESVGFCRACAEKELARLLEEDPGGEYMIDGGYGWKSESIDFCDTCGIAMDNSLLNSGCEEEIDLFLEHGFYGTDWSCWVMEKIISSRGWELDEAIHQSDLEYQREAFARLHKLCRRILDNCWWITPAVEYRHMWE